MAIKTSRAGECAWEPANATALPRRGAGVLARALPPQVPAALNSEKSVEPLGFLAQTVSIVARTLAALLMLGELSMVLQHPGKVLFASCSCFCIKILGTDAVLVCRQQPS